MTKMLVFCLILIFALHNSCEKKQSELEFEQSVVYEIFPALMDSLHFDYRLKPPPPPPRPIFNEQGEIIGTDTTGIAKASNEYLQRKAELKADSVKLVIAINDSVYPIGKKEGDQLLKYFAENNLRLDSTDISTKYLIDLNKLQADKKLRFKYLSEFPEGSDIWKKDYNFHLSGTTSLSRIQFDSTKSFGVLRSGMGCGKLCGSGVRVFIRKENNKWIIDKIIVTEIS
ncbi:hypothetical protein [Robertkochia solimangrovi]|uniref:hypothetical protein n=1 Tax=Robertkochia solimangrovi TaxID=2213046 RepID=UPI00117CD767|nr:hypothetical protein [Robertkochia solimangrovi]TRZ45131.1 hypothetical protein DMZ48_05110 [Robertkochia solimangrovi]